MNKMVNSKFAVRVLALMGCGYLCCLFLKYYANLNTCRLESINYMSKQFYLNKTRENKLHQQTNQSEFNRRNKIHNNNFLDNITLVTAYFLLPPFQKGKIDAIRKPQEYLEWIKAFSWIVNPLIIYLDNVEIYYILEKIFKHSENNFVKLILVKRNQLWIFKQQHKIDEIFRQPNYPVHHPNTVVPAYNCVTHAKFELIKWSIEQNYYSTNYFMWIDIGYFRQNQSLKAKKKEEERRVINSENSWQCSCVVEKMLLLRWLSNSCRVYTRSIFWILGLTLTIIFTLFFWKNFISNPCWQMNIGLDPNLLYLRPVTNQQPPKPINYKVAKSSWSWLNGSQLSPNITIVTAYFELGNFRKGLLNVITPTRYKKWMSVYARILNPLVMYTDSENISKQFQKIRAQHSNQNITKVILIKKKDMWAFQIKSKIDSIFKQDGYPTFSPNTVNAEYSCIMHAKFELLQQSIDYNYFLTKYFMWIDIGYFRYETEKKNLFGLSLPEGFDENSVAYSEVCDFQNYSFKDIVWKNRVWVAGGANLGRYDVLTTFCKEYINRVKKALEERLMSTDQQIIYAMYTAKEKPSSNLQLCIAGWFCLGYLSVKSWYKKNPNFNHTS